MKMTTIALVFGALACLPASADEALKSDAQIRNTTVGSCMNAGKQAGTDEAKSRARCECMWDALASSMTRAEFIEMDKVGSGGGDVKALESWKRVEPKLMACKDK
jgi:hypothetical protein